ncbi:hypothetical protein JL101_036190 (plasmid) [Skermanella rosea]|uniref:hypothetical protein n=1 Tax=Skermanella rosea TaxID=1817965 RepID=UPI001932FA7C|nr:hypothetical protein [Skermanella rosea]UEM08196.1 hypothetical protein JL101_036190 [Skermanella rosea]
MTGNSDTSQNKFITYGDESYSTRAWAKRRGMPHMTLVSRLKRGWSVGEALGFEERPLKPSEQEMDPMQEALRWIQDECTRTKNEHDRLRKERDSAMSALQSIAEIVQGVIAKR